MKFKHASNTKYFCDVKLASILRQIADMKRDQATHSQTRGAAQETLVSAMLDPAFYPNHPEEILHKETHISHIFLVGALVYKIKKPVRFPFLDFSTAAKRRHFLDENCDSTAGWRRRSILAWCRFFKIMEAGASMGATSRPSMRCSCAACRKSACSTICWKPSKRAPR